MNNIIHLTSKSCSLIIKVDRVPGILHWGPKISQIDPDIMLSTERPISQARLDVDVPLTLCPEMGSGHFNAPGIEGHRAGYDWAPVFETVNNLISLPVISFTSFELFKVFFFSQMPG